MSEPMSMGGTLEGAATPDTGHDPGLADAVSTLEGVIGGEERQEGGEPAAPTRQTVDIPPSPEVPERWKKVGEFQTAAQKSHRERERERARLVREYREKEGRWQEQMERQTALNQQLLEHLRSLNPEKAAEIPDPLDPAFGAWLTKQIEEKNQAALKPILAHFEQQQQERQQQAEQAQRQAYLDEARQEIESGFHQELEAYREATPFAHGAEQRAQTWVGIKTEAYQRAGYDPETAQQRALLELYHHSEYARSRGLNGVAAVDALVCAEMEAMGLVPVDPEDDLEGVWNAPPAPLPTNGNGRPAPRALVPQTETERLAAVQSRARGAGNGGPRVAARAAAQASELEDLYRAGETNHRTLMQAALRDHGGNMGRASQALRDLAHRRAMEGR